MSGYSVLRIEDVPDPTGDVPGEMRFLTRPLGCEQVAVTYRAIAPGTGHFRGDRSVGHRHRTQEEVYLLLDGRLVAKLDDELIEPAPRTALRVAPEVTRSFWNGGEQEAVLVIVSTRVADLRGDAELVEGFWPD